MQKRLTSAGKTLNLALLATLSACSTVKDMTNVNLWPFGKGGQAVREYRPANSTPYVCDANKKFFVRVLDKGASVWLILPDREVALAQVGTSKVYSNGISKLDLSSADATLDINETTKYTGCKIKSDAVVAKVEAKAEPKSEPKSEQSAPKAESAKVATKTASADKSEKGWFDWMKFWESDAEPEKAQPAPNKAPAKIEPVKEAKVEVAAQPVVAESPKVEQAKVEPAKAEPLVEAKAVEPTKVEVAKEELAAPAEKATDTNQEAVSKALDAWARAWRTKNVNAYLSTYSAKFKPEGLTRKTWEAQRKERVGANPAEISLSLDKVTVVADAKKATATFVQNYASGKYSDTVAKTLSFENTNGQWLIVQETAKAVSGK